MHCSRLFIRSGAGLHLARANRNVLALIKLPGTLPSVDNSGPPSSRIEPTGKTICAVLPEAFDFEMPLRRDAPLKANVNSPKRRIFLTIAASHDASLECRAHRTPDLARPEAGKMPAAGEGAAHYLSGFSRWESISALACSSRRTANASDFHRRTQAGPARLGRGAALPDHPHWTARILRAHTCV